MLVLRLGYIPLCESVPADAPATLARQQPVVVGALPLRISLSSNGGSGIYIEPAKTLLLFFRGSERLIRLPSELILHHLRAILPAVELRLGNSSYAAVDEDMGHVIVLNEPLGQSHRSMFALAFG